LPVARPGWIPALPSRGERRRWALAQFATAALLIVTVLAIWLSFRPDQKAGPPVGGTATPLAPTPVTGDGPSAAVYRGGAARTGVSPGPGLPNPPVERWTFAPNTTHTDPVVADGLVYTITGNGDLVAVDALTGRQRWRRDTDVVGDAIAPPLVTGGVLYAGLPDGTFYALDAGDGAVRWQYPAGDVSCGSPALVEGVVYGAEGCDMPGTPGGAVFALDAATGREFWRVTIDDGRITTPAVAAGMVFLGAGGPTYSHGYPTFLRAFDAATGQERWAVEVGGIQSAPAVVDGTVYVGSDRGLWAVATSDGSVRWHAHVGRDDADVAAPPAVAVGLVFVVSNDGYLYAFDAGTGEPSWTFHPKGFYHLSTAAPTVVDGVVYFGSEAGDLFAIDAATGAQRWRLRLGPEHIIATAPTIVDGVLYLSARALIALAEPPATPAT
ncbi:MAG TPA: PQQ-binding-like beta-propeller repeat protein, partial [Thermomicrobiales bacterium]|nr:PQQ-binding-like beta-propeller repeat protein [Thermomicrobiales bacterium]